MNILNTAEVAAITVICFVIAELVKATALDNKWLPVIVGVLGGILGVVGWKFVPEFPATDVLNAIAVGIVSGLSATGVHQMYKQLREGGDNGKL